MNYNTKFAMDQHVKIISGLYRGRTGVIRGYIPNIRRGISEDNIMRDLPVTGLYTVKIGLFKTVEVQEFALEGAGVFKI